MMRNIIAGLGCLGLWSIACATQAPAWDNFPVKVNCKVQFDVKFGPINKQAQQNKIPWYLYFPVDPCQNPNAQVEAPKDQYPNWPHTTPCDPPLPGTSTQSNYPNWPTQPVSRTRSTGGNPNITLTSSTATAAVPYWQPTAYSQYSQQYYAPPTPMYYYGR